MTGPLLDRRQALAAAGALGAGLASPALAAQTPVRAGAHRLRCEWLFDPIGIDTLHPRFRWELPEPSARDARPAGVRVLVATSEAALGQGDVWDSGLLAGARTDAQPQAPLSLTSHTPYVWTVEIDGQRSPPARFVTGILNEAEWQARWIAAKPDRPAGTHFRGQSKDGPLGVEDTTLPLLRKELTLAAAPVRAIVSVAGMGHFELRVNGAPVTESVLNPGWTEYRKTVLYTSYDVTRLLRAGPNALGVMLGNGMFNVERKQGRKSKFVDSFGKPKLLLQMTLFHADGRVERVVSDESWRATEGPILFSSMFGGEDVDARRDRAGWDLPGEPGEGWRPVLAVAGPGGKLKAQGVPPVIVHERFTQITMTEPKPGVFVYDLGQNFSGRPEIVVRGPAGATVRFVPAEVLDEQGLAWQRSFNAGPDRLVCYDYTLAGVGEERFVPRFTYHGFRYIQVEGAVPSGRPPAGKPEVLTVQGQFLFSDLPRTGTFTCSKPLFRQIHALIERAVVSNAFSILTDCPHREKLAWLEQTHLNAATILYNRDGAALYEKMIDDIVDTQRADGMVPGIAPEYTAFVDAHGRDLDARNSPEWGAAVILSPWEAYRAYGDTRPLVTGLAAMRRYVDYLASRAEGHLVDFGLGDWYDVGPGKLGASQLTNRALTGSATWYQALLTLAKIVRLLGQDEGEATALESRAASVRDAFNRRFFDSARGCYDRDSQTANAMPLALGMVPPGREGDVLAALVESVRVNGNAVTAGDVGFHYVVRALAEAGRDDVLFDMMSVTDRPSYGYQIAKGATALAEAWNADPTKSLNHFMLGHGEGWLFGRLAGLRVDFAAEPDRVLTVAPRPVGDVESAAASLRTVWGELRCAWQRRANMLTLDVTVPSGAVATILIPTDRPDAVREGSGRLRGAAGIRATRNVAGGVELVAGGGRYRFAAPFTELSA